MTLTEKLTECQRQFNESQIQAVLDDFDVSSAFLADVSQVLAYSSEDIITEIDKWQAQAENAPASMKRHLEAGIRELQKKYEKQSAAEEKLASKAAEVNLVWNSNNGDKELILPLAWSSVEPGSAIHDIYSAAANTIIELDTAAGPEKWNKYTKIVTRDVAKNDRIYTLTADMIRDRIYEQVGELLEKANINLSVINSRIKSDADYKPAKKKKAKKQSRPAASSFDEISNIVSLVDSEAAAEALGVSTACATRKAKEGDIHGFRQGRKTYYPEHDIYTYMFSHKRNNRKNKRAPVWRPGIVELTDETLKEYKAKVGAVLDTTQASELIGVSRSTVNTWLNESEPGSRPVMHGVKYRSNWLIPKTEALLCKLIYTQ